MSEPSPRDEPGSVPTGFSPNSAPPTAAAARTSEADLEARISQTLSRLFPTLSGVDLEHQYVFDIQLGRKKHKVGEATSRAQGRLDILVLLKGKPLAVLELKAPDQELKPNDFSQALSYARLTEPMAPFAIVTNGHDTRWYTTFDGAGWTPSNVDEEVIAATVERGASAAASSRNEAIQALLGKDSNLWMTVARASNASMLGGMSGDLSDITRPLAKGFSIPREIAVDAMMKAENSARAVAIVGPMLSGRTNALAQIAESTSANLVPLYLNADHQRGLFRQIAASFAERYLVDVSADHVNNWIRQAFRSEHCPRLLLLIDGLDRPLSVEVLSDLEELAGLAKDGRVRLILAMDEQSRNALSLVRGRPTKTLLGSVIDEVLHLQLLSEGELVRANLALVGFGCQLLNGCQYSEELRTPRLLRLSAALASQAGGHSEHIQARTAAVGVPSVFGLAMLQRAWASFIRDSRVRDDLRRFASAILNMRLALPAEAKIFIHGLGYLPMPIADRELGDAAVARLMEFGFASLIDGPSIEPNAAKTRIAGSTSGDLYLATRVPELVAAAAVGALAQAVQTAWQGTSEAEPEAARAVRAYRLLIDASQLFPLSDLVVAWVVNEIANAEAHLSSDAELLSSALIKELFADRPQLHKMTEGTSVLISVRDSRPFPYTLVKEDERFAMANQMPWLALSSLLCSGVFVDGEGDRKIHLDMLRTIGSFEAPLMRAYPGSLDMPHILAHDVYGFGSRLCKEMGVVEPITAAFQEALAHIPDQIELLAADAKATRNLPLANRLRTAASSLKSVTDAQIAELATRVEKLADEAFEASFPEQD